MIFDGENMKRILQCCGKEMEIKMDIGKFLEVHCSICNDTIYIKKPEMPKPQMLDD